MNNFKKMKKSISSVTDSYKFGVYIFVCVCPLTLVYFSSGTVQINWTESS